MLRIAVCDDIQREIDDIVSLLKNYQETHHSDLIVQTFLSGNALLDSIDSGNEFDLYLLDIVMPGLSGIALAKELRTKESDAKAAIVFMTASSDYALDAFSVRAANYLIKPIKEKDLFDFLESDFVLPQRVQEEKLLVYIPGKTIKLPYSAISCVECYMHTLRIYLESGEILYSKTIRVPFEAAVAPLLQDRRFIHPHKSFVVNMEKVTALTSTSFVLNNVGMEVHIPRYRYAAIKKTYLTYLSDIGLKSIGR